MKKQLIALFFAFTCFQVVGQDNLVPNPGFESAQSLPLTEAEWFKLDAWRSPGQDNGELHYAAPDFLHRQGKGMAQLPGIHFGQTQPFEGQAVAGITTYNHLLPNFREYLTVKLSEPLDTGSEYRLIFHLSNGTGVPYGQFATHIGALFSNQMPRQVNGPIGQKPQFETEKPVSSTGWEKIVTGFMPDSAYQFLTLGNFRSDSQTAPTVFASKGNPCAYYFIDQVILEKIIPPAPAPGDSLAQAAHNILDKIQQQVDGRRIAKQQMVEVDAAYLEIKIWDDREEDNDQISLNLNGDWIVENYTTTKRPLELKLPLLPNEENFLILFAHSLGSKPPNTAAISFKDKDGKVRKLVLKSDLQSCGAIEIICRP